MGLCSGNFDSTQILQNQNNDLELMDLCSGVFKTQAADTNKNNENSNKISILEKIKNTFDSSDSETDNITKPIKSKHQEKRKLGISGNLISVYLNMIKKIELLYTNKVCT